MLPETRTRPRGYEQSLKRYFRVSWIHLFHFFEADAARPMSEWQEKIYFYTNLKVRKMMGLHKK